MGYQPLFSKGIHELNIEEVHERCVASFFPHHDRREHLFVQLTDFLIYFKSLGFAPDEVWIDGSFVTTKPDPGDIDILVTVNMGEVQHLPKHIQDMLFSEFSSKMRERFECEVYVSASTDAELIKYFRDLFSNLSRNNTYKKKGLIKLTMS
jgi:hypothetical protein